MMPVQCLATGTLRTVWSLSLPGWVARWASLTPPVPSAPPPPSSQLAKQKASGVSNSKGNLLRILKRDPTQPSLRGRKRRIKEGVLGMATAKSGVGESCLQPPTPPQLSSPCAEHRLVCVLPHMGHVWVPVYRSWCGMSPAFSGAAPHPMCNPVCVFPPISIPACVSLTYPCMLCPLPVCITLGPCVVCGLPDICPGVGGCPVRIPVCVFPLPVYTYG